MGTAANKDLIKMMIENVFNSGRTELLPEFFAPEMEAEAAGRSGIRVRFSANTAANRTHIGSTPVALRLL